MADIFQDTINKWGVDAQIDMAIEEMAECILALKHYKRGRVGNEEVASEIADVKIMMYQLQRIFGTDLIMSAEAFKIERLSSRVYGDADAQMGSQNPMLEQAMQQVNRREILDGQIID